MEDFLEEKPQRAASLSRGAHAGRLQGLSPAYAVLTIAALTMMIPFLWQVATSLKPLAEVQSGHFLPSSGSSATMPR